MKAHPDSSLDLTMRHWMPQPVARAYSRMRAPGAGAADQWSRTLGFVDVSLRFLTSVMYCDALGMGLQPTGDARDLIANKFHAPSYGDWSRAAFALGDLLHGQACLIPTIAQAFGTSKARTELATALFDIVGNRNDVAHQEIPFPGDAQALRLLDEYKPKIRALCAALRALREHPMMVLVQNETTQTGYSLTALRLVGETAHQCPEYVAADPVDAPVRSPFLVGDGGAILLLAPLVILDQDEHTTLLETRLVCRWDDAERRIFYSSISAQEPRPSASGWAQPVAGSGRDAFLRNPTRAFRRGGVLPTAATDLFLSGVSDAERFAVPGFRDAERIGEGGTSVVYRARRILPDRLPGPMVAIKILNRWVAGNFDIGARLRKEYELLAMLRHPGIVSVEAYSDDPVPHIVMEYVKGDDLQASVESLHPRGMAPDAAAAIALQMLEALARVHALGIVHRDIKPRNVLIDRNGRARLIDFGIAFHERNSVHTTIREVLGTFDYAAPEQLRRDVVVDTRADVFAVGRVLTFLVTGSVASPLDSIVSGMQAIIRRATHPEREDRFATAHEMADALRERMDARWGGAPIQSGDRVCGSYQLVHLRGQIDGVFAFDAMEEATGTAAVALLSGGDANDAHSSSGMLKEKVKSLSTGARDVLGSPRVLVHDREMLVVIANGTDAMGVLESVIRGVSPLQDVEQISFTPSVPPYYMGVFSLYQRWHDKWGGAGHRSFEILRRAMLVLRAQLGVLDGSPPSASAWRRFSQMSLGVSGSWLRSSLLNRPGSRRALRTRGLERIIDLVERLGDERNYMAHAMPTLFKLEDWPARRYLMGLDAMLELGRELRTVVSDDQLAPFVANLADDKWGVLSIDGDGKVGHYLALQSGDDRYAPTKEATAWLWDQDRRERVLALDREQSLREQGKVREEVAANLRIQPLVTGVRTLVDLPTQATVHDPYLTHTREWADIVVDGGASSPLAVVNVFREFDGEFGNGIPDEIRENLTLAQRLIKASFAGVADGDRVVWFRPAESGHLVALPPSDAPPWAAYDGTAT